MAHFRATIKGSRGEASRCGHKSSGLSASINGWRIGCDVYIAYDQRRKKDVVTVWKTSGSAGGDRRPIARFSIPPSMEHHLHD